MSRWVPLESNPSVLNKYLSKMGISEEWALEDVYGIDEALLAMVSQPVAAVILLYPLTTKEEEFRVQQEKDLRDENTNIPSDVYFMKQYIGNACGTVALIHAVANSLNQVTLSDGPLQTFIDQTKQKNPVDRGHALESFGGIADIHDTLANEGQTAPPDRDTRLEPHFIALVNVNDQLYELDGRKESAIPHGATSHSSFLFDAAKVCDAFMKRVPEESRFAIMALAQSQ